MKRLIFWIAVCLFPVIGFTQTADSPQITGSLQVDMQSYRKDTLIGAETAPEKILLNSYANINYVQGNFAAGIRYEGYFNTLQGFDAKNNGYGIPYRYFSYNLDGFEATVGSFYEQFGNGLIFRTYEDKNIGYDNAMEGVRVKFNIFKGVYIKGLIGRQRYSFTQDSKNFAFVQNKGLVRGLDMEISLNELFKKLQESSTQITLGGGIVSKYQKTETQYVNYADTSYKLLIPENVSAAAGRLNLYSGKFGASCEYAYKINDPSLDNGYIYKPGNALLINFTYSTKGLGFFLSGKRIDNMSFRSDRTATLNDLNINYLPDISKNHTYSFLAMYPFATQPAGEAGMQAELTYKIKKKTLMGGKYGTGISINFSRSQAIDKTVINDTIPLNMKGTLGYNSDITKLGEDLFFQDFNVEIMKKISRNFKFNIIYQHIDFNYLTARGKYDHSCKKYVHTDVGVLDMTYNINDSHSIRLELQSLHTAQDMGNWAMALIEYTISPYYFFTISDQYNYGNHNENLKIHYYNAAFGYVKNSTRIQVGYGKQREGIVCVGGVCRAVPATNGLMISITSSF